MTTYVNTYQASLSIDLPQMLLCTLNIGSILLPHV